jgi:hypothetical protein
VAELSDRRLRDLVEAAPVIGSGIGGTSARLEIAGAPVFVKRVPLTDLERRPENVLSTANLFGMPAYCPYGVGSPGFGAWREVAANAMTTSWVLGGRTDSFPLLYHWRIQDGPGSAVAMAAELADVDAAVEYWHGASGVRRRLEALAAATATVTLFLEYLPQTLPEWLARQVAAGAEMAETAIAMVEERLRTGVAFMNAAGLFHFDAHLGNILTDGQRLYFADLGLATSPGFELSAAESIFLAANVSHDACHTITRLVDWLVTEVAGAPYRVERDAFIARSAAGDGPVGLLPGAAAVIRRYAPVALVVNEFYRRLHLEDRATPYPVDEITRACALSSLDGPWVGSQAEPDMTIGDARSTPDRSGRRVTGRRPRRPDGPRRS